MVMRIDESRKRKENSMYDDNVMKVDLAPTVSLSVNSDITGSVDASVDGLLTTEPCFYLVDIKKPYLINENQVECVVGEWDKDKITYGVRIFFASGNSVWCGGNSGRKVLVQMYGEEAGKKFDMASKR